MYAHTRTKTVTDTCVHIYTHSLRDHHVVVHIPFAITLHFDKAIPHTLAGATALFCWVNNTQLSLSDRLKKLHIFTAAPDSKVKLY